MITHAIDTIALQKRVLLLFEHSYAATLTLLVGLLYFGCSTALFMGPVFALTVVGGLLLGLAAHSLRSIHGDQRIPIVERVTFEHLYIEVILGLCVILCAVFVSSPFVVTLLLAFGMWILIYMLGMRIGESEIPTDRFLGYVIAAASVIVSFLVYFVSRRWGLSVIIFFALLAVQLWLGHRISQRRYETQ